MPHTIGRVKSAKRPRVAKINQNILRCIGLLVGLVLFGSGYAAKACAGSGIAAVKFEDKVVFITRQRIIAAS